jgi:hypothetical protein
LRFRLRQVQAVPLLIWFLLCSTGAYAFVQLNRTSADPQASLAGAASDYRVLNIAYTLGAADPRSIASVKFTLIPSSANARIATVRAKLVSSSASYATCLNVPAGSQGWACPISGVTVAAANQLMLDIGELPSQPSVRLYLPMLRR